MSLLNQISSERIDLWIEVLKSSFSLDHFFGADGLNMEIETSEDVFSGGAHNAYIQLIYNVGPLFAVSILYYAIKRVVIVFKNGLKSKEGKNHAICAGLIAFLAFSLFESHLFFLRSVSSFGFWFLIFVGSINCNTEGKSNDCSNLR